MYKMHSFYEYILLWEVRKQSPLKLFNSAENYWKFTTKLAYDLN